MKLFLLFVAFSTSLQATHKIQVKTSGIPGTPRVQTFELKKDTVLKHNFRDAGVKCKTELRPKKSSLLTFGLTCESEGKSFWTGVTCSKGTKVGPIPDLEILVKDVKDTHKYGVLSFECYPGEKSGFDRVSRAVKKQRKNISRELKAALKKSDSGLRKDIKRILRKYY